MKSVGVSPRAQDLADDCPGIEFMQLPAMGSSGWVRSPRWLRRSIDYLRYLEPRYPAETRLRTRARHKAPARPHHGAARKVLGAPGIAALKSTFQALESCLAPPKHIQAFLAERSPDILLLAHLLPIGTTHADYLRAAKRLGIRSAFPVRGWDNLTNKGLLRDAPDAVLVWNDLQAKEARELHGIPEENLRLTGAPLCDPWFEREPSRSREEFCRDVGLRDDRPILLYVCSSGFVARTRSTSCAAGSSGCGHGACSRRPDLRPPHPLNAAQWPTSTSARPRRSGRGSASAARRGLRDTTSTRSTTRTRSSGSTPPPRSRRDRRRSVHDPRRRVQRRREDAPFHYLKADEFGLLHVARLRRARRAAGGAARRGRRRAERALPEAVRAAARLDRSASGLVADEIERLATRRRRPTAARVGACRPGRARAVRLVRGRSAGAAWRRGAKQTPTAELMRLVRKRACTGRCARRRRALARARVEELCTGSRSCAVSRGWTRA
jgi:hypothetical protein